MPKNLFFELKDEKRTKIVETGISEFSKYGYYSSSTNRIVEAAGISKGSLFKYFENKEDYYFYILDFVTKELMEYLEVKVCDLPKELFQRIIIYSKFELTWYVNHPEKYKLIVNAFSQNDTEIFQKTQVRYHLIGQDIYYNLLTDLNSSQFKYDKQMTIDILKWFLKGFNEDFLNQLQLEKRTDIDNISDDYVKCLTKHMEILKNGLI